MPGSLIIYYKHTHGKESKNEKTEKTGAVKYIFIKKVLLYYANVVIYYLAKEIK